MSTDNRDLDPIDPRTAHQLSLDHKEAECTDSTVQNHRYHTNKLVEWCEENGIENLNELSGRNLQEMRLWRKEVGDINPPCFRNEPCPDCAGTQNGRCGEAASPHAIRRGSITHYLTNDVPPEIVSDRMNVSRDVLDKHYDERSEEVKLEQRSGYLENV